MGRAAIARFPKVAPGLGPYTGSRLVIRPPSAHWGHAEPVSLTTRRSLPPLRWFPLPLEQLAGLDPQRCADSVNRLQVHARRAVLRDAVDCDEANARTPREFGLTHGRIKRVDQVLQAEANGQVGN